VAGTRSLALAVALVAASLLAASAAPANAAADDDRIAFLSTRAGLADVYVMAGDGSGQMRLGGARTADRDPAWSPDGAYVAVTVRGDIWMIGAADGVASRLTQGEFCDDSQPAWSRDGSLAIRRRHARMSEIWTMRWDGSDQRVFTGGLSVHPDWSPDGRTIAFASGISVVRDRESGGIAVARIDGGDPTLLSGPQSSDFHPDWSPDGTRIAFESIRNGNRDVYVMDAAGGGVTRLTEHPAWDGEPAWSPDGSRIAFVSHRDGDAEIYAMDADGSNEVRLTTAPGADESPDWRPRSDAATPVILRPLTPAPAPAVCRFEQARTITLSLRRHARAVGVVSSEAFFHGCSEGVEVEIQRWFRGKWRTVARTTTTARGHLRGRFAVSIPDVVGRYRALARRHHVHVPPPILTRACGEAVSRIARHAHRPRLGRRGSP
jgi:dipeptidyl aminopeptidase/acylaminoacyl peptidase